MCHAAQPKIKDRERHGRAYSAKLATKVLTSSSGGSDVQRTLSFPGRFQ